LFNVDGDGLLLLLLLFVLLSVTSFNSSPQNASLRISQVIEFIENSAKILAYCATKFPFLSGLKDLSNSRARFREVKS
jgi:hypothetical protein